MMNGSRDVIQNFILSAYYIENSFKILSMFLFLFWELLPKVGYSFPVDWWSLGIVAYEMRAGSRPFVIHSTTPVEDVKNILFTTPSFPRHWSANFIEVIRKVSHFPYIAVFNLLVCICVCLLLTVSISCFFFFFSGSILKWFLGLLYRLTQIV